MLAPTVALIPLFRLLQTLGIYNTYYALVVLYTASAKTSAGTTFLPVPWVLGAFLVFTLLRLAAGGFRDMTRIASGHPDI